MANYYVKNNGYQTITAGTMSNGSNQITSATSTGVVAGSSGQPITGPNIPAGTTIVSVTGTTPNLTITLSANATGSFAGTLAVGCATYSTGAKTWLGYELVVQATTNTTSDNNMSASSPWVFECSNPGRTYYTQGTSMTWPATVTDGTGTTYYYSNTSNTAGTTVSAGPWSWSTTNPTQSITAATMSNGSTSVTGVTSSGQLHVDMRVTGAGIPAGTYIDSIVSGSGTGPYSITLSSAATASFTTSLTCDNASFVARKASSWFYAHQHLYGLTSSSGYITSGDTIYVDSTHSFTYTSVAGGAIVRTGGGQIISWDRTNSRPLDGATEFVNQGSRNMSIRGGDINGSPSYIFGLNFRMGNGANSGNIVVSSGDTNPDSLLCEKCTFEIVSTNTGCAIQIGDSSTTTAKNITLNNCVYKFKVSAQKINLSSYMNTVMNECSVDTSGITGNLTYLFNTGAMGCNFVANGCDFLGNTGTEVAALFNAASTNSGNMKFSNCKMPLTSYASGTHAGPAGSKVEIYSSNIGNTDTVIDYFYQDGFGVVSNETNNHYLTSGAQLKDQDGNLKSYSLKMVPAQYANKNNPLYTPWISAFVSTTGAKTVTMDLCFDSATALTTSNCWLEIEYYSSTSLSKSTFTYTAPILTNFTGRDVMAAGTTITDASIPWTGTYTNKVTFQLAKSITFNQVGFVKVRVGLGPNYHNGTSWQTWTGTLYVDPLIKIT